MGFVKRKATTSKSRMSVSNFKDMKKEFLQEIVDIAVMEETPPELILNWDQTGINLVPSSGWTMEQRGATRVEVTGIDDKRQITAVFCGSLTGDFLPLQLVYGGKTHRCHPRSKLPSDWDITHAPKHWSTEETTKGYIENIILPYIRRMREVLGQESAPAIIIMDNFKGQITDQIVQLLSANNVHVVLIPPNCTDQLQPMDLSVNKPAKEFLRSKFSDWYSEQVRQQIDDVDDIRKVEFVPVDLRLVVMRELSAQWLVEMFDYISSNPQFIVNGFEKAGIADALDDAHKEMVI